LCLLGQIKSIREVKGMKTATNLVDFSGRFGERREQEERRNRRKPVRVKQKEAY